MLRDDAQLLALTDRFHAAALGSDTWTAALESLAALTSSRSGQLIGIGADKAVPFNWLTNVDPAFLAEFAEMGGGDPSINPRVRAGAAARVFDVLTEGDFLSPEEHRQSPIYADFFTRADIPFICLTNVIKERDMVIGLTVNRSRSEGNADENVRRILSAVAPHVRAAVRTQIALEGQAAAIIAGAMEALSIAAFVCDRHARVLARSPLTETLLSANGPLRLSGNKLSARRQDQAEQLSRAIYGVASGADPKLNPVVLTDDTLQSPVMLDVAVLPPRSHGFTLEARVLVIGRVTQRDALTKVALLRSAFALTSAEAEVAVALLAGLSSIESAASRTASVHTVRSQIKSLYSKLSVTNRGELAARLALLG